MFICKLVLQGVPHQIAAVCHIASLRERMQILQYACVHPTKIHHVLQVHESMYNLQCAGRPSVRKPACRPSAACTYLCMYQYRMYICSQQSPSVTFCCKPVNAAAGSGSIQIGPCVVCTRVRTWANSQTFFLKPHGFSTSAYGRVHADMEFPRCRPRPRPGQVLLHSTFTGRGGGEAQDLSYLYDRCLHECPLTAVAPRLPTLTKIPKQHAQSDLWPSRSCDCRRFGSLHIVYIVREFDEHLSS